MSSVRNLVEAVGFRMVRGSGGAEQYRLFSQRTLPVWLVLTAENDTLSVPSSMDAPVNLAVFHKDPDDQSSDPHKEQVFPNIKDALSHVLRHYVW